MGSTSLDLASESIADSLYLLLVINKQLAVARHLGLEGIPVQKVFHTPSEEVLLLIDDHVWAYLKPKIELVHTVSPGSAEQTEIYRVT
jgi:hypothetical protein